MNGKFKSPVKSLAEVLKPVLCLHIGLSALFGFVLAAQELTLAGVGLGLSILVLSLGCAALNNVQDREFDLWFARTQSRALPSGRLRPKPVAVLGVVLILSGIGGLTVLPRTSLLVPALGILAVVCYNGLYTPLKKTTLWAIVPGTISGMLPPMIGWAAGGGFLLDHEILLIAAVMGLWQIPHFFLILLKSGQPGPGNSQYPSFARLFPGISLKLQVMIWCGLYSLALFLYLIRVPAPVPVHFSLITAANALLVIFWTGFRLFYSDPARAFAGINISILAFMGTGIWSALA